MQMPPQTPHTTLERAASLPIGMLVGGIGRFIFDAATDMKFILLNKTIVTWTAIAGIVIPVVALILLNIAKANLEAKPAIARGLAIPVLFMMIGGVLIAVFGMSYFAPYSYTVFDTFVKDVVNTGYSGTERIMNIFDDMFVIIVLAMAVQGISLVAKFLSPNLTRPAGAIASPQAPQAPQMANYAPPSQPFPQPYAQPYVQSSYQSYVQRPSQTSWQPNPAPSSSAPAFPRFCKYCGAKLPDEAHFCGHCGRTLMSQEPAPQPAPLSAPVPEPASEPVVVVSESRETLHITVPPAATHGVPAAPVALASVMPVPASQPGMTAPLLATPDVASTTVPVPPPGVEIPLPQPAATEPAVTLAATTAPATTPVTTAPATTAPATATVTPRSTTGQNIDGAKVKEFFRQFTDWEKTKSFFRWLGSKVEQGFGWAYQKAFKKIPNQKTTWSCILLMVGIVVAFIIVGALLTPGPFLAGSWRTAFATTFNVQTDFRNPPTMTYEGSQQRTMTWTITRTFNVNIVDVEVSFSVVSSSINGGSGYTPDVSPMGFEGRISGTRLTLVDLPSFAQPEERIVGEFSFTSSSIMGTWNDTWEMAYRQSVYTAVNGLILVR